MTCEEYLLSYRRAMDKVRDLDVEIAEEELRQKKKVANYEGIMVQSSKDPNAKLDPLGQLLLNREKLLKDAEAERQKVSSFIRSVGGPSEVDKRSRQLLRLYYCDDLDWREVQRLIMPLKERRDGRRAPRRRGCVSESSLYRLRQDAMMKADRAYRQLNKYTR